MVTLRYSAYQKQIVEENYLKMYIFKFPKTQQLADLV